MFHRNKGKDKAGQMPEEREAKSRTEDSPHAALTADTSAFPTLSLTRWIIEL